ncbi:MAG: hypothetical protein JOZ69_04775, partial [Myxococcales bacterium]|nr:hypothetical protein [Myxococcales bacterium]
MKMKHAIPVVGAFLAALTSACTSIWGLSDVPKQEAGEDASLRDGGADAPTADGSRPGDARAGEAGRDATQVDGGDASTVGIVDTRAADPCAANNGGCDPNAACVAQGSVPVCTCKSGYSGSGTVCAPINSCDVGH